MNMDAGMDTGPVLNTQTLAIDPNDTAATLSEKIAILGADLLLATLPGYLNGTVIPTPQSESGITYASLIDKKDGLLDFSQSAEELERKVRAFNPWPSAFFYVDDFMIKIHQALWKKKIRYGNRKNVSEKTTYCHHKGVWIYVIDEIQCSCEIAMNSRIIISWKSRLVP
jgi:methionyl-tRNA formyltransferase